VNKHKRSGIDYHNWDKSDTKTRRRQRLLNAMHGNYLKAGRELTRIASRTTDPEVRAKALSDANYFFAKHSTMHKR